MLKHYLNHWGITVDESTFKRLYEQLDYDGDGIISYADFQRTVGARIHPGEGLFFRQDVSESFKISSCDQNGCWQPTKQGQTFCPLHKASNLAEAHKVYRALTNRCGHGKLKMLVHNLRKQADAGSMTIAMF